MTREEFHQLYERAPEHFKAELIGGIVYVAPPLQPTKGTPHAWLLALLCAYQSATPGVELFDNATLILDEHAEPQPDLFLRIRPECGGRSRDSFDGYVDGPPELVIEIAHSIRAIDVHNKMEDYFRCGVPEYLIYLEDVKQLRWFNLTANKEYRPNSDGIYRMRQFPGLWIDSAALVNQDEPRQILALQQGLLTPEHTHFVRQLNTQKSAVKNKEAPDMSPGLRVFGT